MNSRIGLKDWSKVEPRLDGDLRQKRVARCKDEQEVLDLLSSVRWEHIKAGLLEAGIRKNDSLLPAIAYLAKHGWNDNLKAQVEAMKEQFGGITERLLMEKLEEQGKVGRSTVSLLIPAHIMRDIRGSADPVRAAQEWRDRLEMLEKAERAVVSKRAMEALARIGTPSALAELGKLLLCKVNNKYLWAASILAHAARERPGEVVPILKRMASELDGKPEYSEEADVLRRICERVGKDAVAQGSF